MDTSKIPPPIKDPEIKHTQVRTDTYSTRTYTLYAAVCTTTHYAYMTF